MSKIYEALKKAELERERIRQETGHPVPRTVDTAPLDIAEEEYQKLRASLTSIAVPSGLHTILVTPPRHGEGATTVAVGLASALAKERDRGKQFYYTFCSSRVQRSSPLLRYIDRHRSRRNQ